MKSKFSFVILIVITFLVIGCNEKIENNIIEESINEKKLRDYSIQSVLWQQNAGEYRALCYQAYNIAQLRLDQFLEAKENQNKKLAVITDIDETIMDNSMYNAHLIIENKEYIPEDWTEWVEREEAWALPGAVDFLQYAQRKNVEVFYVTNRFAHEREATLRNMEKLGFPYADTSHILLKTTEGSKEKRFDKVREKYKVVLYVGDNLLDFKSDFRITSTEDRNNLVNERKEHFGYDFIVLPNPMYGDWETHGIYENKYDWTLKQKDSIWKSKLKYYK